MEILIEIVWNWLVYGEGSNFLNVWLFFWLLWVMVVVVFKWINFGGLVGIDISGK